MVYTLQWLAGFPLREISIRTHCLDRQRCLEPKACSHHCTKNSESRSFPSLESLRRLGHQGFIFFPLGFRRISLSLVVVSIRIRLLAGSKGYKLDDHGCYPVTKDANGESVCVFLYLSNYFAVKRNGLYFYLWIR